MKHWERKLELLQQPVPDDNEQDGEDGDGGDEEEKEEKEQQESGQPDEQPDQNGTFEIVENEEDSTTQALGPAVSDEQLDQVPTHKQGEEEEEEEDDKAEEGKLNENEDEEEQESKDPFEDEKKPQPKTEPKEQESDGKVRENEGKKQEQKDGKKRKYEEGEEQKDEEGEDHGSEDEEKDEDAMDLMEEQDEQEGTMGEDGATIITNDNEEEEEQDEAAKKRAIDRELQLRQRQEDKQKQLTPSDMARLRDEATRRMQEWEREDGGRSLARGEELWGYYQRLTAGPAQRLCEQLRLVLEPTQRSKMEGDYRTGKRVNMRKVITYIASQYRKDKIWMRRTKPAKRQYQVLLAIDDSLSMREDRAGALALEAMAVIAQALTQLEAGELAVASFGERTELLHPFGTPFAGTAPAHVLSSFSFGQEKTKTAESLELLLQQMTIAGGASTGRAGAASSRTLARGGAAAAASGGSASGKPLQLMLVISDGILQEDGERERIRMLMRDAAARRQLLVLIVIDMDGSAEEELKKNKAGAGAGVDLSVPGAGAAKAEGTKPKGASSILQLRTATFVKGRCVFRSYLEDYPFPYYIFIREVEALPNALSDALRQWFEMMQRSD